MLSKKEIFELPEDSTGIYKRSMVSRYLIRSQNENDSQPEELIHKPVQISHLITNSYPDELVLSSGERLNYPKVKLVLQYHIPNVFKDTEVYAHYLLFIFYSFHDYCQLKVGQHSSYSSKLSEPRGLEIVNNKKSLLNL